MGNKRGNQDITKFFGNRTAKKKEDEATNSKQPPSKRPRSSSSPASTDKQASKKEEHNGPSNDTVKVEATVPIKSDVVVEKNEAVIEIVADDKSESAVLKVADEKVASPEKTEKRPSTRGRRSRKPIVIDDDDDEDDEVEDKPAKSEEDGELKTCKAEVVDDSEDEKPEIATEVIDSNDAKEDDSEGDEESNDEVSDVEEEEEKEKKKPKKKGTKLKDILSAPKSAPFKLTSTATWKPGKPVPYKYLAEMFEKVEEITGRLAIQAILTDVFRVVIDTTPEDLVPVIYLSINKLAPSHEGVELGAGESILIKALSDVTGVTAANLRTQYKKCGDLGDLAAKTRAKQKTMFPLPPLTVRKVFGEFRAIAGMSGKNTQETKRSKIVKMMVAASRLEAKYIARALQGKLRIHLADKTVITSLASAMVLRATKHSSGLLLNEDGSKKKKLTQKEEAVEEKIKTAGNILQNVYSQLPVWDKIVPEVLKLNTVDEDLTKICKLTPGIPVAPMLAKPTKSITEVLDRFSETEFTCEFKYDGERAQVHCLEDGTVKIYSRNAENLTEKYPDLVASLPLCLKEGFKDSSFIIDGESVAYDTKENKILPFQVLQGRKRKDVDEKSISVKVCVFAFDILYFNGNSLIHESLEDRRKVMTEHFAEKQGVFMFAKGHDSKETEEILTLLNDSIKAGCEGLMVKALRGDNGTYEPANRSQNWLKVKKDYLEGCGDTLDLVPIGGYLGRGKRAGAYGAFLLACYDPDSEEYQSICKIGTGFTDVDLESIAKYYNDPEECRLLEAPKPYYRIPESKNLVPDKWFEPCQVWEVLCADLSISPQHTAAAGRVDDSKGIALRFPRFMRLRDDKAVEDATSAEQVAELYSQQSAVANQGK